MKKLIKAALSFFLVIAINGSMSSQICNSSGNLIIYSNYDGGIIYVNCDVNIPNIKIGICTYEAAEIHVTGTFSNNVTGIIYAGFDGSNDNCSLGVFSSTIIGVSASNASINVYPSVGPYNPVHGNGNPNMDGCYQCDTTVSSGGVNSPDEVVYYFLSKFSGSTLRSHETQYGCWTPTTYSVSGGGNCCLMPASTVACGPPSNAVSTTPTLNLNICSGKSTTLSATSTGTVNWYATNASTTILSNGNSFTTPVLSVGTHTYFAGAVNSCSNSLSKTPIVITVNAVPNLTLAASSATICKGQTATLTASGASTYTWSNNATTAGISVSPTLTTTYFVTGQAANTCINSSSITLVVSLCTNIAELNEEKEFSIYPNPTNGKLNVTTKLVGNKKIQISDMAGKLIYAAETDEIQIELELKTIAKGIYLFSISQKGVLESVKLIVD